MLRGKRSLMLPRTLRCWHKTSGGARRPPMSVGGGHDVALLCKEPPVI
jgi:hypothetical protein